MTITYILLNGPPGCGKTTIARELSRMLAEKAKVYQDSLVAPMKHFVATALGLKYSEADKERAVPELAGYSIRQFLINLSEEYIKSTYGQDVWARWLVHRALRYTPKPDFVIVDDLGFQEEVEALDNFVIVQIHRAGHTFDGDSRSYIPEPHWSLTNDGPIDELWIAVRSLAWNILNDRRPDLMRDTR